MAERYGFELSLDTDWETVSCPEAVLAKRLEVMSPILQADGVINLAKFKTHMFMIFSGATKNLFGVIPGLNKAVVSRQAGRSPALRRHAARRGLLRATPPQHRRRRSWAWRATDRAPGARRGRSACWWPAPTR